MSESKGNGAAIEYVESHRNQVGTELSKKGNAWRLGKLRKEERRDQQRWLGYSCLPRAW